MNNKGFTLIEIISVVALLAIIIIITVPMIGKSSENVKKKTLQTKIDNIEKAAVLYGQDNRGGFTIQCRSNGDPCYNVTGECSCYDETITVKTLIDDERLKEDKLNGTEKVIVNPLDEDKTLNACKIQIYQKYGKIYAVYEKTESNKNICWSE